MAYSLLNPGSVLESHDFGNGWIAYKQGKLVTIVGSSTVASSTPNPVIGTLPSGWAPPALVIAPIYINKAYSTDWAPYMRVTTAGAVQLFSQGYSAAAYGSISYAIA